MQHQFYGHSQMRICARFVVKPMLMVKKVSGLAVTTTVVGGTIIDVQVSPGNLEGAQSSFATTVKSTVYIVTYLITLYLI